MSSSPRRSPRGEHNRALGIFGACASAGFSVGLVAGGVLTDVAGWRWIFLAKVPFVLAAALLAWRVVPESRDTAPEVSGYDLRGAALAAAGLLLAVLVITQLADPAVEPAVLVALAAVAAGCLAAFVANERRVESAVAARDLPHPHPALRRHRVAHGARRRPSGSPTW